MVMTLHRLSAGAGYQYLLKHTAAGDCDRAGVAPLTDYYTESGNPPGLWLGKGLAAVDLTAGALVTEATMANLFGAGRHPLTGQPLGKAYPVYAPPAERIAAQTAKLPQDWTLPSVRPPSRRSPESSSPATARQRWPGST